MRELTYSAVFLCAGLILISCKDTANTTMKETE